MIFILFIWSNYEYLIMSGDNLYGKQPIRFYSEDLTITKLILIKKHFNLKYDSKFSDNSDQIISN